MKTQLRFLIDVGVSKAVEEWLAHERYDVRAVHQINPHMSDREILQIAATEDRVVITMDKDFGELVYRLKRPHTGVLLIRMAEARGDEKLAAIQQILRNHSDKLHGRFCVYQNHRLRVRD